MVGSGSEVDVTVELKEKASAPEIYTITSSSGSVECENVTFANNTKTATTTCEVDPGCEIGSYKLTVTASLNDSKTSIDYHVVSAAETTELSLCCVCGQPAGVRPPPSPVLPPKVKNAATGEP